MIALLVLLSCAVEGPQPAIDPPRGPFARALARTPPPDPRGSPDLVWQSWEDQLKVAERVIGQGAEIPQAPQTQAPQTPVLVTLEVTAWLPDGTRWWSTYETPEPTRFWLGQAPVRAWDRGVRGMAVGGVRLLDAPPALAFGEDGATTRVPADTPVLFELELLAVQGPPGEPAAFVEGQRVGGFEVTDVIVGGGEKLWGTGGPELPNERELVPGARYRFERTEWLPDGTLLGSSRLEPVAPRAIFGEGKLRWEAALAGMREGGTRQVRIPGDPSLGGPGEETAPVVLPAGSPLILSIEILEIE